MRTVLNRLGLVLVALVTLAISIAVFSRVAHAFGMELSTILTVLAGLGAAWAGTHTPESRAVADDVIATLGELGIPRGIAADRMGMSDGQLARQLAGLEMLSAYRLAQIGSEFREAYHRRSVERERRGLYLANSMLLDILHHVRVLTGQHVVTSVSDRSVAA